ncbi:MAG: hypothetical protein ACJ75A_14565, partial [Actinomycetes bacterium]
ARLRDRVEALEHVLDRLRRLEQLRGLDACVIAPALDPGWRKAFFIRAGALCAVRLVPPGPRGRLEINAGLAIARHSSRDREPLTGMHAEDMLLLGGFIRRPSPELTVLTLEGDAVLSSPLSSRVS